MFTKRFITNATRQLQSSPIRLLSTNNKPSVLLFPFYKATDSIISKHVDLYKNMGIDNVVVRKTTDYDVTSYLYFDRNMKKEFLNEIVGKCVNKKTNKTWSITIFY